MKYGFKAGLLFALALSPAPIAANAYPVSALAPLSGHTTVPIVKAGCCNSCCDGCERPGCDYWRPRYSDYYWRPRYGYGWGGEGPDYGHSRYYSHYRWGSYRRYWRPYEGSGWGD